MAKITKAILKRRVYTCITDAGHGWLSVAKSDLKFLGIEKKISGFSYQNGSRAYLEEDCDAGVFVKAYRDSVGTELKLKGCKSTAEYSYVRSFADYRA